MDLERKIPVFEFCELIQFKRKISFSIITPMENSAYSEIAGKDWKENV